MALTRPKYSQIYDTDWKNSVKLATTADVGDLLTSNAQPNSVDGVSVTINDRILVKDQGNSKQNGLYFVRTVGTGANGWWTRTLDANQDAFVTSGLTVDVTNGSTNAGKTFKITTVDPIFLGNTGLSFQISTASSGGANTQIQFNDNNALNGSAYFTYDKYSNAVSIGGSLTTFNAGNISAGGYFLGNGSQLTGIASGYSNVQVATYLPTYTGIVTASNVAVNGNVTAQYILGSGQFLTGLPAGYSNVNVKAYTESMGFQNYSNVNLSAYLGGNVAIGTAGAISGAFHTFVGNITQTSSGGAVYINTTGNVIAASVIAGTSTIGGLTLTSGTLFRNGGETQILGGGAQTTRAMIRLGNGQGMVLYGSGTAAAPNVPNDGIIIHGGDGNIQLVARNTASGGSRIQMRAELVEIQGNITPVGNLVYNIGNATNQWNTIFASNISATGNVTVQSNLNVTGNVTVQSNLNVTGNVYSNSGTDPLGYVYTMDDLASQFDGSRTSFTISVNDGTVYSVNSPNQISLQIGGVTVAPTRFIRDYQNLTEVSVFTRGFYLQTGTVAANASIITGNNFSTGGNTIVFATAPSAGMSFYGTVRTNSDPVAQFTFKQSPFTALNIMLGS
jgi:hypothetical protein